MNTKTILGMMALLLICFSCSKKDDDTKVEVKDGSKMLLIGNSFFRPYAENLDALALDAGLTQHDATVVFRGGENGRPINFWNDSTTEAHAQIKTALDEGGIEYFGMTAGHDSIDRIEGHRAWINYALQNNPDVKIFIAIPALDFPQNWEQLAADFGYSTVQELYTYFIDDIIHQEMVDPLREEFPNTSIFTIPTGWAAIHLAQMQQDGNLLDEISLFGPKPTSIFTDQKGHQGQIVIETGTLVWLSSLYGVDLNSNTYQTGFNTDLHSLAKDIVDNHNLLYSQQF